MRVILRSAPHVLPPGSVVQRVLSVVGVPLVLRGVRPLWDLAPLRHGPFNGQTFKLHKSDSGSQIPFLDVSLDRLLDRSLHVSQLQRRESVLETARRGFARNVNFRLFRVSFGVSDPPFYRVDVGGRVHRVGVRSVTGPYALEERYAIAQAAGGRRGAAVVRHRDMTSLNEGRFDTELWLHTQLTEASKDRRGGRRMRWEGPRARPDNY